MAGKVGCNGGAAYGEIPATSAGMTGEGSGNDEEVETGMMEEWGARVTEGCNGGAALGEIPAASAGMTECGARV